MIYYSIPRPGLQAKCKCLVKFWLAPAGVRILAGANGGHDIFEQIMIFHTTGLDSSRQISYTVKAVTLALFADKALPVIWRRAGPGANAT